MTWIAQDPEGLRDASARLDRLLDKIHRLGGVPNVRLRRLEWQRRTYLAAERARTERALAEAAARQPELERFAAHVADVDFRWAWTQAIGRGLTRQRRERRRAGGRR